MSSLYQPAQDLARCLLGQVQTPAFYSDSCPCVFGGGGSCLTLGVSQHWLLLRDYSLVSAKLINSDNFFQCREQR